MENKKVVQIDNYDRVELWARGMMIMKISYKNGVLESIMAGNMTLTPIEPGVITELKKEGLYDEPNS